MVNSPKYIPHQRNFSSEASLRALSCILGDQRRGGSQMSRLEQALNRPDVVLVVGVIAVALNILLYFGYFIPRTTPIVEQVYSIGTSLPEASSNSHPEDSSKSGSELNSKSGHEAGSKSDSEASGTSGTEESLKSSSDSSPASLPNPPQDSPSGSSAAYPSSQQQSSKPSQSPAGSPPELPPLPTPTQDQY